MERRSLLKRTLSSFNGGEWSNASIITSLPSMIWRTYPIGSIGVSSLNVMVRFSIGGRSSRLISLRVRGPWRAFNAFCSSSSSESWSINVLRWKADLPWSNEERIQLERIYWLSSDGRESSCDDEELSSSELEKIRSFFRLDVPARVFFFCDRWWWRGSSCIETWSQSTFIKWIWSSRFSIKSWISSSTANSQNRRVHLQARCTANNDQLSRRTIFFIDSSSSRTDAKNYLEQCLHKPTDLIRFTHEQSALYPAIGCHPFDQNYQDRLSWTEKICRSTHRGRPKW